MTYDQALALVKTAMKFGQPIGVEWNEVDETFALVIGDNRNGQVKTESFVVALSSVATTRVR